MGVISKICGLRTQDALDAAVEGGANMVGLVFFPPSPRALSLGAAQALCRHVPSHVRRVGLVVDMQDDALRTLTASVALDMLQLHGTEPPERVVAIKAMTGLPVIKACSVRVADDVTAALAYVRCADMVLFDALPPTDASRPGGNAVAFDWSILKGVQVDLPWLLAGGLDADNVAQAVRACNAPGVDVSSGVEDALGVKSPARIRSFLTRVHTL